MPTRRHPHSRFIDQLGGTASVSRLTGEDMRTVSNWRTRGIARDWRKALAKVAEERGIAVPARFIPEDRQIRGVAA